MYFNYKHSSLIIERDNLKFWRSYQIIGSFRSNQLEGTSGSEFCIHWNQPEYDESLLRT